MLFIRLVMSDSLRPHTKRPHANLVIARQIPVHGISQAIWIGWPFPSPGDLPDPGIELESPLC